jgi:hypothetical protein
MNFGSGVLPSARASGMRAEKKSAAFALADQHAGRHLGFSTLPSSASAAAPGTTKRSAT